MEPGSNASAVVAANVYLYRDSEKLTQLDSVTKYYTIEDKGIGAKKDISDESTRVWLSSSVAQLSNETRK
ncbi:hypothetical protein RRG08_037055 [Elysia crispata]|uniref:Uncharacterized protein n=1 Tax=Elysia crispata TaxID=231223 RepID=A0AAE0YA40_9GAST|nr:hypothetical protein RRG08_037055 [Elysia crispata]